MSNNISIFMSKRENAKINIMLCYHSIFLILFSVRMRICEKVTFEMLVGDRDNSSLRGIFVVGDSSLPRVISA